MRIGSRRGRTVHASLSASNAQWRGHASEYGTHLPQATRLTREGRCRGQEGLEGEPKAQCRRSKARTLAGTEGWARARKE